MVGPTTKPSLDNTHCPNVPLIAPNISWTQCIIRNTCNNCKTLCRFVVQEKGDFLNIEEQFLEPGSTISGFVLRLYISSTQGFKCMTRLNQN